MYDTRINLLSIFTLLLMLGVLGAMFVLRDRMPMDEGLTIPGRTLEPQRDWLQQRAQEGLLALYTLDAGKGDTITDRAGKGDPLNLISDIPPADLWQSDGLHLDGQTVFTSLHSADAITQACRENHAFTLEIWLRPESIDAPEEVPILALYGEAGLIVGLAQGGVRNEHAGHLIGRSLTASPSGKKAPLLACPEPLQKERTHLVFVGTITGRRILYLNSIVVADDHVSGDLSNWKKGGRLSLGGMPDGSKGWKGRVHLAAIYGRALSAMEIRENFSIGLGNK